MKFTFFRGIAQHVVPLTVAHRQDSSPRGIQLQKDILLFNGRQTASESAVKAFLERLDACVIHDPARLAPFNPRIVLQRNAPRHRLNTRLIQHQAAHLKLRLTVWNARHHPVRPKNGPEPPLLTRLEHEAALRTADAAFKHLPADTWYYPGALFTHHGNGGTDAGACNNSLVRAVGLITDPREPPDNGTGPHRRLHFMPLAVFVKPVNVAIPANIAGEVYCNEFPGAFPVVPVAEYGHIRVPDAARGHKSLAVARTNMPLGDAYAVTDFFVQGYSFKNECWLLDLAIVNNSILRSCLFVLLSLYRTWDDVKLLRPLHRTAHEKALVLAAFCRAARMDPDLAAEHQLHTEAFERTKLAYPSAFTLAASLTAHLPPPVALPPDPVAVPEPAPVPTATPRRLRRPPSGHADANQSTTGEPRAQRRRTATAVAPATASPVPAPPAAMPQRRAAVPQFNDTVVSQSSLVQFENRLLSSAAGLRLEDADPNSNHCGLRAILSQIPGSLLPLYITDNPPAHAGWADALTATRSMLASTLEQYLSGALPSTDDYQLHLNSQYDNIDDEAQLHARHLEGLRTDASLTLVDFRVLQVLLRPTNVRIVVHTPAMPRPLYLAESTDLAANGTDVHTSLQHQLTGAIQTATCLPTQWMALRVNDLHVCPLLVARACMPSWGPLQALCDCLSPVNVAWERAVGTGRR